MKKNLARTLLVKAGDPVRRSRLEQVQHVPGQRDILMGNKRLNRANHRNAKRSQHLSARHLKKELKLIPYDIKREMRFLDLLLCENNQVRTRVEREVVQQFIAKARAMVKFHQKRLERYEECYRQLRQKKTCDPGLLQPEELQELLGQGKPSSQIKSQLPQEPDLRTGTHG